MDNKLGEIYKIINTNNHLDLLAKLWYLTWMLRTDAFSDISNQPIDFLEAKSSLYFVTSYVFSHTINIDIQRKISYKDIISLMKQVSALSILDSFESHSESDLTNKLKYTQNDSGELLPYFYFVPFIHILSSEDDLLQNKFNCKAEDILDDYENIKKTAFNPDFIKGSTVHEFITNFDKYCDIKSLSFPTTAKSYNFLSAISCSTGEINEDEFIPLSPLSLIKKHRKILLNQNGFIYCFDLDMFPNLIIKCAERALQENKQQNHRWDNNMKIRTEKLIAELFQHYFKGGTYYQNLTFENKECSGESDGLFEYLGYLFIIEIKAGKISPDPVDSDDTTVHSSYNKIIGTASNQCKKVEQNIRNYGGIFKDEVRKITFDHTEDKIIKLVISFEDLSAVLPDEDISSANHTIFISYYDLLIVFDFINNPLLLLKYFVERTIKLNVPYKIADEMIYLGIFRDNMDISNLLNSQHIDINEMNITDALLDLDSFTQDIELSYSWPGNHKPTISLTWFQKLLLNIFENNTKIRMELAKLLIYLPSFFCDDLAKIYHRNNNDSHYSPQASGIGFNDGEFIAVMLSKKHKGEQRYIYYAIAKRFFKKHNKALKIISLIDDKEPYAEIIMRNQKELNYQKTIDTLNDIEIKYTFREINRKIK